MGRVNVQDMTQGQAYELLARCGNKIEMFVIRLEFFLNNLLSLINIYISYLSAFIYIDIKINEVFFSLLTYSLFWLKILHPKKVYDVSNE